MAKHEDPFRTSRVWPNPNVKCFELPRSRVPLSRLSDKTRASFRTLSFSHKSEDDESLWTFLCNKTRTIFRNDKSLFDLSGEQDISSWLSDKTGPSVPTDQLRRSVQPASLFDLPNRPVRLIVFERQDSLSLSNSTTVVSERQFLLSGPTHKSLSPVRTTSLFELCVRQASSSCPTNKTLRAVRPIRHSFFSNDKPLRPLRTASRFDPSDRQGRTLRSD